nr:reverse transcriptase domain-containing protein [Tanacetum cinerariifolium]
MTDLGALNYFLGISATRHSTGLFLSQKQYAIELLARAHMTNCNPSRTSVDTDSNLGPEVKSALARAKAYKKNIQTNPTPKIAQNPDPVRDNENSGEKNDGLVSKVGMEAAKEYSEKNNGGLQPEKREIVMNEFVEKKPDKKDEGKISAINFVGLGFADKKEGRGLPAGLVPISDPFPSGDSPEVEILVRDMSRFGKEKPSETNTTTEDDSELYKPKVSTWGVFPRPSDISKTFGGGKTIQPGEVLETAESKAAKNARTRQMIAAYKQKMGLDIDPKLKSECEKDLKDGDSLMDDGRLKDAIPFYERVMDKLVYQAWDRGNGFDYLLMCLVGSWLHPWDPTPRITPRKTTAMANTTLLVTTVVKPATNPRDSDATPRVNIQEFCEEYYEDILPFIMDKVCHDRQKDVHTRLDFGEGPREKTKEDSHHSSVRARTTKPEWVKRNLLAKHDQIPPRETDFRDPPRGRSRTLGLNTSRYNRPKDRERFRSIGESYDDSFSHSYRDGNRSRHIKRRMDNESPLSSVSRSDSSDGKYRRSKSKKQKSTDEDDLTRPWMCEEEDPFTPRIRNFESSRKTRMPNNVKTYDGTGDPEDHGAHECMQIFGFMHEVNNPELTKRLNEHVPRIMEEMMITTTACIRGEAAAASEKKGHASLKAQDQSKRQNSDKSTDECTQLKKQIEELVRAGKLSHLIKEIKHGRDQSKIGTKETAAKDKPTAIYMIQSCQRTTRQKVTQSFERVKEISFPPLAASSGTEGPLVIEAEMGGDMIHCMYVDGGSSMEILYEHCFNWLRPEIKSQLVLATTSLTDFSGETIWPLGQLRLLVIIGDTNHSTRAWMNFMIVRSLSPYNGIIGRPGIRAIKAIPSTVHGMLKFPAVSREERTRPANFKVALHPDFPDQEVAIGGTLLDKGRTELCSILKKNLDIFAWQPSGMTGVPRSVAEHRLNIREGYSPVRQKKKGQAPERYHQIQLAEPDEEKTTFHTGQGVYCYTKMPFGLKNAGATYQRLMDKAFESQLGQNIEVYVDDLVVKSYIEAEMMRDIEETFRALRKVNMKLNPKKCSFGLAEGMFLGYVVTPEGIKPCSDKTAAVLQLPLSRTIKEVQSLNGKLASLNRFLSESAKKSLPLFQTLKKCIKRSDFHWTAEAEQAFKQLKQHLYELPLLVAPKPKEELIIYLSATYGAISSAKNVDQRTDLSRFSHRDAARNPTSRASGRNSTGVVDAFHGRLVIRVRGTDRWSTDSSADGSERCTCTGRSTQKQIHKRERGGNSDRGGPTDLDDTDSGLFKRRNSPRRQEGGKKAPPQGPTIRVNGGNSLQAVVPYAVVKMWNRHSWPFSGRTRESQNFDSCHGLLYEWIEAKAVATIIGGQVKKFAWDNIVCRFGIPAVDVVSNDEELRLNLDLLEERRERAAICEAKAKSKMIKYYNARVRGITFKPGDFVYRSNDASNAVADWKLGAKWEGPYEVTEALGDGAYKLWSRDGTILARTWNIANLKRCYL